ncbi:hypothetical protein GS429_06075 [Natronorubrum sp. JWXQ-INN-674]|uniref:Uncharacterized protein n=1 Tax=Natronorubrum halalkaliphilum TaxID=2691917 RepID=A0A6B0VKK3_9EURY|nr:hypothetical protein [Natronorubrum halalkaliphilum]MXV61637.1 hypothetical protein [Natronorubrum halalkaliphilum]
MCGIPTDTPWEINWDRDFETSVQELKQSGSFDAYRKKIIRIMRNPVREGSYKSENLKGMKTAHIPGNRQDIICFEITPGINDESQKADLEELYFHFIDHWDNYDSALTRRDPANVEYGFEIYIPYYGGPYEVEKVINTVYQVGKDYDGINIAAQEWEDEHVTMTGEAAPDDRHVFDDFLPDAATIEYDDISPF